MQSMTSMTFSRRCTDRGRRSTEMWLWSSRTDQIKRSSWLEIFDNVSALEDLEHAETLAILARLKQIGNSNFAPAQTSASDSSQHVIVTRVNPTILLYRAANVMMYVLQTYLLCSNNILRTKGWIDELSAWVTWPWTHHFSSLFWLKYCSARNSIGISRPSNSYDRSQASSSWSFFKLIFKEKDKRNTLRNN